MGKSRRNYYRILYLQPEAPPEVIRAAYRALMQTLRMHPDLGGSHEQAALINEAYAVLKDPQKREDYDRGVLPAVRRTRSAGGSPPARPAGPDSRRSTDSRSPSAAAPSANTCAFCREPLPGKIEPDSRCGRCRSPLAQPPRMAPGRELVGRRAAWRVAKSQEVTVQFAWRGATYRAWLSDISLAGMSLRVPVAPLAAQVVRVLAPDLEALVSVVRQREDRNEYVVHCKVLTMLIKRGRGVFVRTTA